MWQAPPPPVWVRFLHMQSKPIPRFLATSMHTPIGICLLVCHGGLTNEGRVRQPWAPSIMGSLPVHASISVASFLVLGGGGGKTPKCTDKNICTYIARASASETYIFRTQIHLHTYAINAVSYNTYGIAL